MYRELMKEFLVLVGIFFCVNLMIPFLFLSSNRLGLGLLGLLGFAGLLYYSKIHIHGLLKSDKTKQAIVFFILIITTTAIAANFSWTLAHPHLL